MWRILKLMWITGGFAFNGWLIYSMQAHGVSASVLKSSQDVIVSESDDLLSRELQQKIILQKMLKFIQLQ